MFFITFPNIHKQIVSSYFLTLAIEERFEVLIAK